MVSISSDTSFSVGRYSGAFAHPRDLGVFIEDIQDFALNALKVFALAETCHGALIFLLHPLQRFFTLQLFQPQEFIAGGRGL
ncbi:hypothetical protein ISX56_29365 [Serratia ureilytica]|nr:hypothetical protein [Serratia ureilytica]